MPDSSKQTISAATKAVHDAWSAHRNVPFPLYDQEAEAIARAAIEALRNPSDRVLLAPGEPYGGKVERPLGLQARRNAWNRMLDAILSEVA